jgi:hypothetical protein
MRPSLRAGSEPELNELDGGGGFDDVPLTGVSSDDSRAKPERGPPWSAEMNPSKVIALVSSPGEHLKQRPGPASQNLTAVNDRPAAKEDTLVFLPAIIGLAWLLRARPRHASALLTHWPRIAITAGTVGEE